MRAAFAATVATLAACPAAAAPPPPGAIAIAGPADPATVLRAAQDAGGATWRVEPIAAATGPAAPPDPTTALEQLYVDADFARCLSAGLDPSIDVARLVADGAAIAAARAAVFVAGCALGRDPRRAEDLLRRALIMELAIDPVLALTATELQQFAHKIRTQVTALPRHRIEVATQPPGAAITVDGKPMRCGARACTATVIAGEHVVVARRFGRLARVAAVEAPRDARVVLALDPAPRGEARTQLAVALGAPPERAPPGIELGAVAADAFGTRVVVVVRARAGGATALLFDRATGKVAAIVDATGRDAAAQATRQAIGEWRADLSPSILRRPVFWIAVGTAVASAGVATYLLARDQQHDLTFQHP